MRSRRLIIGFAVGLAVVSIASALTAPPEDEDPAPPPPVRAQPAPPPRALSLRYPPPPQPAVTRVRRNTQVTLRVSSTAPGQVAVDGLGLVADLTPAAPATFDVLAVRPGRFDVTVTPVGGERRRVGTLVVE